MLKRISIQTAVVLAVLAICVAMDLRVALRGDRSPVSIEVMKTAAATIEAQKKPGDLVVHSPLFSMRELAGLGALSAGPALPPERLRSSRRVLVLDLADQPMHGFGEVASSQVIEGSSGAVILSIVEPVAGDQSVLFELVSSLDRAKMYIERPVGTVVSECGAPRAEGGKSCPGQPGWLYLAPRQLTVGGQTTACVWAHPTTGGAVVIELPGLPSPPPGRQLELQVSGGLTDEAARNTPGGASVLTAVEQGGERLSLLTVPNRQGWFHAKTQIAPEAPVQLRVTAARDGRRHHCLNAEVREVSSP